MPLAVSEGEGKLEVHDDRDHDTEHVLRFSSFDVLVLGWFNCAKLRLSITDNARVKKSLPFCFSNICTILRGLTSTKLKLSLYLHLNLHLSDAETRLLGIINW